MDVSTIEIKTQSILDNDSLGRIDRKPYRDIVQDSLSILRLPRKTSDQKTSKKKKPQT
jgi:hypothetical protein